MLDKRYMTPDWAYLIGRNMSDRNWPEDNKAGDVLCEIRVRPGEIPTVRDIKKAVRLAKRQAIYRLRFVPNDLLTVNVKSSRKEYPWMCACGYEGNTMHDHGICPICCGYGLCPWNG